MSIMSPKHDYKIKIIDQYYTNEFNMRLTPKQASILKEVQDESIRRAGVSCDPILTVERIIEKN